MATPVLYVIDGDRHYVSTTKDADKFGWKKHLIAWIKGASGNDKRVCLEIREDRKI